MSDDTLEEDELFIINMNKYVQLVLIAIIGMMLGGSIYEYHQVMGLIFISLIIILMVFINKTYKSVWCKKCKGDLSFYFKDDEPPYYDKTMQVVATTSCPLCGFEKGQFGKNKKEIYVSQAKGESVGLPTTRTFVFEIVAFVVMLLAVFNLDNYINVEVVFLYFPICFLFFRKVLYREVWSKMGSELDSVVSSLPAAAILAYVWYFFANYSS